MATTKVPTIPKQLAPLLKPGDQVKKYKNTWYVNRAGNLLTRSGTKLVQPANDTKKTAWETAYNNSAATRVDTGLAASPYVDTTLEQQRAAVGTVGNYRGATDDPISWDKYLTALKGWTPGTDPFGNVNQAPNLPSYYDKDYFTKYNENLATSTAPKYTPPAGMEGLSSDQVKAVQDEILSVFPTGVVPDNLKDDVNTWLGLKKTNYGVAAGDFGIRPTVDSLLSDVRLAASNDYNTYLRSGIENQRGVPFTDDEWNQYMIDKGLITGTTTDEETANSVLNTQLEGLTKNWQSAEDQTVAQAYRSGLSEPQIAALRAKLNADQATNINATTIKNQQDYPNALLQMLQPALNAGNTALTGGQSMESLLAQYMGLMSGMGSSMVGQGSQNLQSQQNQVLSWYNALSGNANNEASIAAQNAATKSKNSSDMWSNIIGAAGTLGKIGGTMGWF